MRIVRYYPRAASGDGGITGANRRWSRGLARAGAQVVIAYHDGVEPAGEPAPGIEWRRVRHAGPEALKIPLDLSDVLRGADLLVLHSAWTMHNVRAASCARGLGVPYVLEPRGAYDPHIVSRKRLLKRGWWLACERMLVLGARGIHVFFEQEQAHLHALGWHGPFVVAPNGVEPPPAGLAWDGGSGGYVLWLGRFDPEHKGLDLLLCAMRMLPSSERPMLRLHGPDWRGRKAGVRDTVREYELDEWVTIGEPLHGRAKYEAMSRATGFVYPSRWEAFGNSTAEAASLGVPVLATPYPLGRYLASQGAAVLADATPQGLAAGLRALGDSSTAAGVGRRAAQVAREELSWDEVARRWLAQAGALL